MLILPRILVVLAENSVHNKSFAELKLGILLERKNLPLRFLLSKTRSVTFDSTMVYDTVLSYFQKIVEPIF